MTGEEFEQAVTELETRLERLRSLYEQYFLGIERIEPGVARKDVDRRFWLLRKVQVRNTARRFRFQNLIQRYNTLQQYWRKTCRQIELGTYPRHQARLRRRADFPVQPKPAPLPPLASVAPGPPKQKPQPTDIERRAAELHEELELTQRMLDPSRRAPSKAALAESLRVTEARLLQKHAGRKVDFRVVVQDGKATIKPVIRKDG